MGIELGEDERWDFIKENRVMNLSTIDSQGNPHVVPIWYIAEKNKNKIYFSTPEDTHKVKHLDENSRVSASIDEGIKYFKLRCVIIEGNANLIRKKQKKEELEKRWCQKYFNQPEKPDFMNILYKGRKWVWYQIEPEKFISWDNSKIDLDKLK